jgi:hypothetical protein
MSRSTLTAFFGGLLTSLPIAIAVVLLDLSAPWYLLSQFVGALTAVLLLYRADDPRHR